MLQDDPCMTNCHTANHNLDVMHHASSTLQQMYVTFVWLSSDQPPLNARHLPYCLHTHSSSLPLTLPPIAFLPLPLTPLPVLQCQRHTTVLPGGSRAGFFIGDAAGVGKGRQARTQHLHPLRAVCCLWLNTVVSTQSVVVDLCLKQGLLSIITRLF